MVNIEGIPKPTVLCALYNASKGIGIGVYQANPKDRLTYRRAEEVLSQKTSFDFLYGRCMYVDLTNDIEFDETEYDKWLGEGHAQKAINNIRKIKENYSK